MRLTNSNNHENNGRIGLPCAFVGAYRSSISVPTSMITGLRGYPQVSGSSTSKILDDKSSYPLFARTVATDHENSGPILQFFRERFNVRHLAVLHANDAWGNAFAEGLMEAVKEVDMTLVTVSLPTKVDSNAIHEAVETLKISQFRYFFAVIWEFWDDLMLEAYNQGIAGTGKHNWFFGDTFTPQFILRRSFPRGSVLQKAYNGIGLVGSVWCVHFGTRATYSFLQAFALL